MDDTHKMYAKIGSTIIVIGAVLGLFIHGHDMESNTNAQYHHEVAHANTERLADMQEHEHVKHELFGHAVNSKDPIIKSIAINNDDNEAIHKPLLHFFNVYYNWKNHNDYVARPKELRNYATKAVLGNKKFFDNDKDSSGGSIVNNEQLNSEFNNLNTLVMSHKGSNIDVMADVQYNAWNTSTDNQKTGEKWFEMNYNTKQHKFTSMKALYTAPNVSNDNN